jgi:hypothetical protein
MTPPVIMEGLPGGCCGSCGAGCVTEHYLKKTDKTVYSCGSEPYCVLTPRGLFGHGCCGCAHYTKHYLIKKTEKCERDAVKCVPVEVPTCQPGCCVPAPCAVTAPPVSMYTPGTPLR